MRKFNFLEVFDSLKANQHSNYASNSIYTKV